MIDKDKLLEDFNLIYRASMQEVQDKRKERSMLKRSLEFEKDNLLYLDYLGIKERIEWLDVEIKELELKNEGMDRSREIILDAERVEE